MTESRLARTRGGTVRTGSGLFKPDPEILPPARDGIWEQLSLPLDEADRELVNSGPSELGAWIRWLRDQNLRTGRPA